jgi:hypothetical protein
LSSMSFGNLTEVTIVCVLSYFVVFMTTIYYKTLQLSTSNLQSIYASIVFVCSAWYFIC